MWTFPISSFRHHEFRSMNYVPKKQRSFQAVWIEFLTLKGLHVPFEDKVTPTKVVLHFRMYCQW